MNEVQRLFQNICIDQKEAFKTDFDSQITSTAMT
jgi:hypothetical protein